MITAGIDVGTTKIAANIIDDDARVVLASHQLNSNSEIFNDGIRREQDVSVIMQALTECILALPLELRSQVEAIGVTGQMHGVVRWNPGNPATSTHITWEDKRAGKDGSLDEFRLVSGNHELQDGYGISSLAWLAKQRESLSDYRCASTIHDYVVSLLCNLEHPVTEPANAASWGMYDQNAREWNSQQIELLKIPRSILPTIVASGEIAGHIQGALAALWGLPIGAPVMVATGDNQAGINGSLSDLERQISISIGTSSQLSVVMSESSIEGMRAPSQAHFEIRPFRADRVAAVAASLNGGNVFTVISKALADIVKQLGLIRQSDKQVPNEDDLLTFIHDIGAQKIDAPLSVLPTLWGERFNPNLRAEVNEIDLESSHLGNLMAGTAFGIVENLKSMLPAEYLRGKNEIVGMGGGLRRSKLLRTAVEKVFALPLTMAVDAKGNSYQEAAFGAALFAARSVRERK